MENQSILDLKNIKKYIGLREIFSDASFNVHEKDKIAIVGQNGKGKTTLLRIIVGLEDYDEGEIDRRKNLRVGYLSQKIRSKKRSGAPTAGCMASSGASRISKRGWKPPRGRIWNARSAITKQ